MGFWEDGGEVKMIHLKGQLFMTSNRMRCWKLDEPGYGPIYKDPEVWKQCAVPGLHEFMLSTEGRVKRDGLLYTPLTLSNGYLHLDNTFDSSLHRALLATFKPNPRPDYNTQVDHINRNIQDNRLENLRWVSRQINNLNKPHPFGRGCSSYTLRNGKKRYRARLMYMNKKLHLGCFDTLKEADARFREALADAYEILVY